jgi:hypothetical protein
MDKTISLNLEITPKDYANAADSLQKRHFLVKYNFAILPAAVFLLFAIIIYLMADAQINILGLILFSLIPALILWVALLVLNEFSPRLISRKMKKIINSAPLIQGNLRVNFTDEGIEFLRELTESKMNWLVFTKAIESEREFLLYWGANQEPFFIPKRAFASAEDLNFVRCLMRAKLAEKAEF